MDFILGIFTGATLMIAFGTYINYQDKKRKAKQTEMQYKYFSAWLREADTSSLEQQLQDAINREDFKEAARLRDLINRK